MGKVVKPLFLDFCVIRSGNLYSTVDVLGQRIAVAADVSNTVTQS